VTARAAPSEIRARMTSGVPSTMRMNTRPSESDAWTPSGAPEQAPNEPAASTAVSASAAPARSGILASDW
jgi:hypothetical protein